MSLGAVVVAAGEGTRLGGVPKPWRPLDGPPMLAWAIEPFRRVEDMSEIIAVVSPDEAERPPAWLAASVRRIVPGGETRRASVARGLAALSPDVAVVLIHDGARPFVSPDLVRRVARASVEGAVVPVLPVTDTVKLVGPGGHVLSTLDRGGLRRVQTPQGFPLSVIHELHAAAEEERLDAPDDAFLCERAGVPVRAVDGEAWNLKVTTSADLAVATWLAESGRAERAGACRPTWGESDR